MNNDIKRKGKSLYKGECYHEVIVNCIIIEIFMSRLSYEICMAVMLHQGRLSSSELISKPMELVAITSTAPFPFLVQILDQASCYLISKNLYGHR